MSKYVTPSDLSDGLSGLIDPDGGFLCMTSHWRPNPQDPNPDMPGQKLSMNSYIPVLPTEPCLCGSDKAYGACCQRRRMWHSICPNPGMQGYSLLAPQSAVFRRVDGQAIRERLTTDSRLRCTEDKPERGFWIFWGDPPIENQYGILCFGDVELKRNHTLLVTAMSDLRRQVLLDVLTEILGDHLGKPRIKRSPVIVIDKRTGKSKELRPKRRFRPKK